MLLHKAYDISFESEKIKKELIYGYIECAFLLDRKGDIERALDNMLMAYEMAPEDPSVIMELAYLYAKKASEESEKGNVGEAFTDLRSAIDIAARSKKASDGVSIYLFNEAVEAYNRHDDNSLLLCLSASYILRSRFETLDLLGQYYHEKGNAERALFYWKKAGEKNPDDIVMKAKVEKAKKELALSNNRNIKKLETEYFDVSFYGDYELDAEFLKDTLEKAYNEIGEDLDHYPSLSTPMIFYSEKDFRDIFKQTGIVRAFYDGSIRMVLEPYTRKADAAETIVHEYTHAVLSMLTDNKCPAWLHEGIAVLEQSGESAVLLSYVRKAVGKGEKLSIERIEKALQSIEENEEETVLAYESAYTAVLFMLDKWGWSGLRGLLDRIRRGRHYANAIDEEFYLSVPLFERMWNEYLSGKLKLRNQVS
jgi:tetratricopeptide (TPR) repeat protein